MDDLAQWLGEQLDVDERIAKAVEGEEQSWDPGDKNLGSAVIGAEYGAPVVVGPYDHLDWSVREFIAEHDPARVLREIEAKRAILTQYQEATAAWRRVSAVDDWSSEEASRIERGGYPQVMAALALAVKTNALVYADRPGYREEWCPS